MITTLTTSWFRSEFLSINWSALPQVGVAFFVRTPGFNTDTQAVFDTYQSMDDLNQRAEWVPIESGSVPLPDSIHAKLYSEGTVQGLQLVTSAGGIAAIDDPTPYGWQFYSSGSVQDLVTAVVFYLQDPVGGVNEPIMFATTQGIGEGTVIHDQSIFGQFENFAVTRGQVRALTVDSTFIPPEFTATYLLLQPALPAWESAHAQHLWLEPQRTNLIVNPSFEAASLTGWRYGPGTGVKVLGGVDAIRPHCGQFGSSVVMESNTFPVPGTWVSFSAYVSVADDTDITFGLVGFDTSYTRASYYCSDQYPQVRIVGIMRQNNVDTFVTDAPHGFFSGERVLVEQRQIGALDAGDYIIVDTPSPQSFTVSVVAPDLPMTAAIGKATVEKKLQTTSGTVQEGFRQYQGMILTPVDTVEMCFRVEVPISTTVWIDNVLVDPHEGQYVYFDGNSVESFPDDYRWMGGRTNNHFSCWYNNYINTHNRLFSDWDENEQRYKAGLVEEWAPTGASIIDHWDAVTSFTPLNWAGNAFYTVNEVSGTPISAITSRQDFQGHPCPAAFL